MLKKISTIGYTAALATAPAWVTACSTTPAAAPASDTSVLFSLSAERMHFENAQGLDATLVMEGVDAHTIWFTDRPVRKSGAITTGRLAAEWESGGTFAQDPPNAALVLQEPVKVDAGQADTLVAEMENATYDAASETLRAQIKVLTDEAADAVEGNLGAHGDNHDTAWPTQAGAVSLFIDSVSLNAVTTSPTPKPGAAAPNAAPGSPSALPSKTYPSSSGHIVLCSNPQSCNSSSTPNYT